VSPQQRILGVFEAAPFGERALLRASTRIPGRLITLLG
jgi:hypothetical protein